MLDNLCEALGDEREAQNKSRQEEKSLIQSALDRMHLKNRSVYKHAGVELALVPGSDRLRIRLVKDQGDASVEAGETQVDNAGEGEGEYDAEVAHEAE